MARDKIGFIGVGNMGGPMASNMVAAGHRLVIHDVNPSALKPFGNKVQIAASPAEVASEAEIVMVSLPRPEIVHGVVFGERGVVSGDKRRIFVDLSTTGPRMAKTISDELKKKGVVALDAPVSGGVVGAVKGTVAVMLAGPKREADLVAPLLGPVGKVFYIGAEPGMGQTMKLINNLLSATAQAATAEALVMGTKFGLDANIMIDVLNAGTGRNNATVAKFPAEILPRRFQGGFGLGLMVKDLKLAIDTAENLHVPMWIGEAVKQLWLYAEGRGGPDQDSTELIKHLEAWSNVTVKGK
ncbi:MAG TPA: NAD(P)-dependent oxidoreductase [Stellaceae bacterium]|jgi:3-hydroxyisobutyrate dehydrogenase-like beta-hydroxyacid dehydrogenase|nr:NAD(P)-dependent oxidoreductase [Stellaceae bacterium]